jgi:AcrR family transcriptional regulator
MAKSSKPLSPKPDAGMWQAEKSRLTRIAILEATTNCLVKLGYAQTTMEKIAKEATLSRGALTHHFRSTAEVFNATAEYIVEKRSREFSQLLSAVDVPHGNLPTIENMRETVAVMHKYYAMPSFVALQELIRGARTDKVMNRVLMPLERSLDRNINEILLEAFPFWKPMVETQEVLTDIVVFALQGLAMDPTSYLEGKRLQHFLDEMASLVMREFSEARRLSEKADRKLRLIKK